MGFGKVELIRAPYETSLLFLLASLELEMMITVCCKKSTGFS